MEVWRNLTHGYEPMISVNGYITVYHVDKRGHIIVSRLYALALDALPAYQAYAALHLMNIIFDGTNDQETSAYFTYYEVATL